MLVGVVMVEDMTETDDSFSYIIAIAITQLNEGVTGDL